MSEKFYTENSPEHVESLYGTIAELRAMCDEFNKSCKYAFNSLENRKTLPGTAMCMSDMIERYEKWKAKND